MTCADALAKVLHRAESRRWEGSDPYDTLLSPIGRLATPLGHGPRFIISQLGLRLPIVRRLLAPPLSINPKALGLFVGAYGRSARAGLDIGRTKWAAAHVSVLEKEASVSGESLAWGYPFPWQSRAFWAPAGTPNAVVTATVGWHLIEAADPLGLPKARSMGIKAARFLAEGLPRSPAGSGAVALAYTPNDRTRVVNISALGARLLARAAGETGTAVRDLAGSLTQFVLQAQRADGSWPYSTDRGGGWEDSFHTGFVLEALLSLRDAGLEVPESALRRGFGAYERFFDLDGGARLWARPDSVYDAHSAAQGILTYSALAESTLLSGPEREGARERARRIASWALSALWIPEQGRFGYRLQRGKLDKRDFIRWVQAWMALAMATMAAAERATSSQPIAAGVA